MTSLYPPARLRAAACVKYRLNNKSDEIKFTSAASTISQASCIIRSYDNDDDNAMQKADTYIY